MHSEVLSDTQRALLPLIRMFSRDYYMVGGTAIALQIGHRRSIDFDLFTSRQIQRISIRRKIEKAGFGIDRVIWEDSEQVHLIVTGVKMTFFSFPFPIEPALILPGIIRIPDLLTLAAMKAFALGGRAKWKDYVDLYFLFRDHLRMEQVITRAKEIFGTSFSEKLFREQLAFFKDIDYAEEVDFLGDPPSGMEVKDLLQKLSGEGFFDEKQD